jgi:flagellin
MAQVINTNVLSLNAQRNLSTSGSQLATALQRLSSGLRINSAKDDAAGLAISNRFTTQINGLNVAARNANDGISLSQTAESALGELTNNLQRIRELAVQSANATNSASDRQALDLEVQQRLAEIDRIATQTSFNGQKVLDGTFGTANFQVGANAGETISINLSQGVKANQIGQIAKATSTAEVSNSALSGSSTIQVGSGSAVTIGASKAGTAPGQTAGSAWAKAAAINASSIPGLAASAVTNVEFAISATTTTGTTGTAVATSTYSLQINGKDIFANFDQSTGAVLTTQQISDAINAQSSTTGVTAALSGTKLLLSASDGRDVVVNQTAGVGAAGGLAAGTAQTVNGTAYTAGSLDTVANGVTATSTNGGTLTFSATQNIVLTGDGTAYGFANANNTIALDTSTIGAANVLTVTGANDTIQRIDSALTSVSSLRSTFGAIQNRFESTIANLQSVSENLSASRSRILDTDFAAETANLTRAQILQQAGTAILAQANSVPQNVLSLLR